MNKIAVLPIQSKITKIHHYSLDKNKGSNHVIHVTVRPVNNTKLIRHQSIRHRQSSSTVRKIVRSQVTNTIGQRYHCSPEDDNSRDCPPISTIDIRTDQQGAVIDFHQKKKKKLPIQCIIGSLLVLLLLMIIIITVSLVLLLKKETTQIPTPTLRWNTTGITVAGMTGVRGSNNSLLNSPLDVTLDYLNTLYIADASNNRVQKYFRDASNGATVAGTGTNGTSPSQLNLPSCVLHSTNGDIFIVDTRNHRIQFWSNGSTAGLTVAGSSSGINGTANNLLNNPFGMDRNPETGTIYIADYYNHRIVSYASGTSSGVVEAGGTGPGINNTQLSSPVTIYLDISTNSFVVVNFGLNNVVRWILGDNHWTLLAGDRNGSTGNTSSLFSGPRDLTLDPMGNLYVLDKDNHRVQFIPVDQSTGVTIAGVTGISGNHTTLLNTPRSVALDSQLNLYVADTSNHRIQKFRRY